MNDVFKSDTLLHETSIAHNASERIPYAYITKDPTVEAYRGKSTFFKKDGGVGPR